MYIFVCVRICVCVCVVMCVYLCDRVSMYCRTAKAITVWVWTCRSKAMSASFLCCYAIASHDALPDVILSTDA